MSEKEESEDDDAVEIKPPDDAPEGYQMEWNAAAGDSMKTQGSPKDNDDGKEDENQSG